MRQAFVKHHGQHGNAGHVKQSKRRTEHLLCFTGLRTSDLSGERLTSSSTDLGLLTFFGSHPGSSRGSRVLKSGHESYRPAARPRERDNNPIIDRSDKPQDVSCIASALC